MSEKYRPNPFYNGVSSFKAAFPNLTDALIEWRELHRPDDDRPGDLRKTGFRRGNFTQGIVPCSNPACHEGGYQLDRLIAEMLGLGQMQREGMMLCSGREVAEEVRRGPVRCPHRIMYKVLLVDKLEERPSERDRQRERQAPRRGRGRGRGPRGKNVA